ncbi:hypothetical protein Xbed_02940 [Xenorhabdus beddingii]|uniref:BAAT/Acyl-CoA thioester hydrolase C-terminal domain-containing protein n=1 Tax=Xenorhabdus beddingii TaxID=40578 RepID=A0A1Y2SJ47_9GAMM|nr:acyl-CoA thioester hydrolase/BAAT C-terminal domain-containing protein [Xenorhabdus beddingii]OTA18823.1 hypothetical protein Xbed_02940 [Xenorhabdus beddingii]
MKKILIFIVFVLTPISLQAVAEQVSYSLQGNDGKDIIYYLISRDGTHYKDLLVLIQGSDCKSVINNRTMIENFGATFPDNDILLVEKSGLDRRIGKNGVEPDELTCPQEYMQGDSPSKRVKDYLAVLHQLKNRYRHIVLLGGSEGAIITNMIASDADFITAAISMNGGGRFFIDDVIQSIRRESPEEMTDEAVNNFKAFAEKAKKQQLPAGMTVSKHGTNWWHEVLSIDNQKMIQSSKTPLLVIQTMSDHNVDAAGALQMMAAIDNPMVSFKTYEGLDHFFKDSDGNDHASAIIKDIKSWYQLQVHGRKQGHEKRDVP